VGRKKPGRKAEPPSKSGVAWPRWTGFRGATSGGGGFRTDLETWSGLAAMGAGILAITATAVFALPAQRVLSDYLLSFLFGLSTLLLTIALPGLQTRQAGLSRRLGRAGFILAAAEVDPEQSYTSLRSPDPGDAP
jgi:hypothetical protein